MKDVVDLQAVAEAGFAKARVAAARAAVLRGRPRRAFQIWKDLHERGALSGASCLQEARALREAKLIDACKVLLGAAQEWFDDSRICQERAELASQLGDWAEAVQRWEELRARRPEIPRGFVGGVHALRMDGRIDEADALAEAAMPVFPGNHWLVNEYALVAKGRRDWEEAARRWEGMRARFPDRTEGFVGGVRALCASARMDEAEALAARAIELFPDAYRLLVEYAQAAHLRKDWPEAARRWAMVRGRIPQEPRGFGNGVYALRQIGRLDEAEALIERAAEQFPDQDWLPAQSAQIAHARQDWKEAARRWEVVRAHSPDDPRGFSLGARALRESGRIGEAEALAEPALRRFSGDPGLAVEYAWCAARRSDFAEAVRRAERLRTEFPTAIEGFFLGAQWLLRLDRSDDAEALLAMAMDRFPNNLNIMIARARLAARRQDLAEAVRRWQLAKSAHQNVADIEAGLGHALQALRWEAVDGADKDHVVAPAQGRAIEVAGGATEAESAAAMLLRFESLGWNCQFGIVQRAAGVEPLGLLRWTKISPDQLTRLLEMRFEGVGDVENTEVRLSAEGEYMLFDSRYFAMHTFLTRDQADPEKLPAQMRRRLVFLKDKLISDLQSGEKIFVYAWPQGGMSDAEVMAIRKAMESYGRNILFCVRHPELPGQDHTVVKVADGLLFGYLSQMQSNPLAARAYYPAWLKLCEAAYHLVRNDLG